MKTAQEDLDFPFSGKQFCGKINEQLTATLGGGGGGVCVGGAYELKMREASC